MGPSFSHAVLEVARKEVMQHLRAKRLLIIVPIFFAVMLFITVVVPGLFIESSGFDQAFEEGTGVQNMAMLLFFSGFFVLSGYFYLQLLPIVLSTDAVSSEWESRTLFLLLSKPVSRAAMVLGKFIGSSVVVVAITGALLLVDYLVAAVVLPGNPSAEDWQGFLGALGILMLGTVTFCAVGLFFSTLARSTVTGMLMSLAAWIFVFPMLGSLDSLIDISSRGIEAIAEPEEPWSVYLSPTSSMRVASNVLAPLAFDAADAGLFGRLFGFATPGEPWLAALALAVQAALFVGLSVLVVQRRNFE